MRPIFQIVTDLHAQAETLRAGRHGVIEVVNGRLQQVRLRPFRKIVSLPEVMFWGDFYHRHRPGDRCRLFYDQVRGQPNYLCVKYVLSGRDTTLASLHGAMRVLDEIARIKGTDAVVSEAFNIRISDRLAERWGWQKHKPSRWRRHFIKRFYGSYPAPLTSGRLLGV
jgi:hypothetical protein